MGNCCSGSSDTGKKVTLAIVGLDNAGKTVTTKGLQGEPLDSVAPTIGFSSADFKFEKYDVKLFDLGGGKRIRNIWEQYLFEIYGLIYVVDSSETERMDECRKVLQDLLENPKVSGKPVLLLANKQDKPGAMDEVDICEGLNLEELVNRNKCPCRVEMCAAIVNQGGKKRKLDQSINDGMQWLLDTIYANYEKLDERVAYDTKENDEREAHEKKLRAERVRKVREERERERDAAKARGEIPESDPEDEDPTGGDPFKKLSAKKLAEKDAAAKEKKRLEGDYKRQTHLDNDNSDDSIRRLRRRGSNDDVKPDRLRNGLSRTPRETRTRSRSPSPNGRTRARSLSPPIKNLNTFDNFSAATSSRERLVGRQDSLEEMHGDPLSRGRLPWMKSKRDDPDDLKPRLAAVGGRGLAPLPGLEARGLPARNGLEPLDRNGLEPLDAKKKKKKKSKRNQITPEDSVDEDEHDDTPRDSSRFTRDPVRRDINTTPPLQRSAYKASKSPRLAPMQETEHEMDSFASKWGLVDELPELPPSSMTRRSRPNYDDDIVT